MRPALIWLAGLWTIEAQSCVDDTTWISSRGNCASYAVGQPNNIYCTVDAATTSCPSACQASGCGNLVPRGGVCSTNSQCATGLFCKMGLATVGTCVDFSSVSGTTCSTHDQCGSGNYCFSCFSCQSAVGYVARGTQCGACYENVLSPRPSGCAPASTCSTRRDAINGVCPTTTASPINCGTGTVWCASTASCLSMDLDCPASYPQSNNVAVGAGTSYTGGISVYSGAQPPIAGQKDVHGCRNGMGEFWCESQNACLYYTVTCIGIPKAADVYGCVPSDGYSWCAVKNRCIQLSYEPCAPISSGSIGAPIDQYGCQISQGYFYCSLLSRCIQPSRESCVGLSSRIGDTSVSVGGADNNGCYAGGGYTWCAPKSKCLRLWEEACEDSLTQQDPSFSDPATSGGCPNAGEEYKSCSSMCEPVCGQPPAACIESCGPPKCQCRDGWSRSNGACVLNANCPGAQPQCPDFSGCQLSCPAGFVVDSQGCRQCQCNARNPSSSSATFGPLANGGFAGFGGFNSGSSFRGGFNSGFARQPFFGAGSGWQSYSYARPDGVLGFGR